MEIKKRNRTELKSYFVKNAIPTENNFADLIDATLIQASDGVAKPAGDPLSVEAVGDNTSRRQLLNFYDSFSESGPLYSIELNPRSDPDKPATGKPGLSLSDGAGYSRIFIQSQTGYVGIGTNAPTHTFHVKTQGAVGLFESTEDTAYLQISNNEGLGNRVEFANRGGGRLALWVAGGHDAFNILKDGRVGIGTTEPTHTFHVKTQGAVGLFESTQQVAYLRIATNEGLNNRVEFVNRAGGRLALWVAGGKDSLSILRDGKVGIGTTNPKRQLHVGNGGQISLMQSTGPAQDSIAGLYWSPSNNYSIRRTSGAWTSPTFQQLMLDWRTGIVMKPGTGNNTGHEKSYVHIYGGKGLRVSEGPLVVGGIEPGDATLRVAKDSSDCMDVRFASSGAGKLQFVGWSDGWNINTLTDGNHLYLNRDAGTNSNVYIGRSANPMHVLSNGRVSIKGAPLGGATFSVNGSIRSTGTLRADDGIIIGSENRDSHLESDGSLYRYGGQMYIVVDDNLFIRDLGGNIKFHFDTNSGILRQEDWTGAQLLHGWTNYNNSYNQAAYYKSKDGRIYLRGLVKDGVLGEAATIFTLPSGYRPPAREIHIAKSKSGYGRVDISTDGRVIPLNFASNKWVSLDGISFRP